MEKRIQVDLTKEETIALTTCASLGVLLAQGASDNPQTVAAIRMGQGLARRALDRLGSENWNELLQRIQRLAMSFPHMGRVSGSVQEGVAKKGVIELSGSDPEQQH